MSKYLIHAQGLLRAAYMVHVKGHDARIMNQGSKMLSDVKRDFKSGLESIRQKAIIEYMHDEGLINSADIDKDTNYYAAESSYNTVNARLLDYDISYEYKAPSKSYKRQRVKGKYVIYGYRNGKKEKTYEYALMSNKEIRQTEGFYEEDID